MTEQPPLPIFEEEPYQVKQRETVTRERIRVYGLPISEYHVTIAGKNRVIYSRRKKKLTQKECELTAKRIDQAQEMLDRDIAASGSAQDSPKQAYVEDQALQLVAFVIHGSFQKLPKTDYSMGPLTPLIKQAAYRKLFTEGKRIQGIHQQPSKH